MNEIPRCLQAMIEDARRCLEQWEDDKQPDDDGTMDYVKEWTVRLSRGEYEQDLYWKCAAEDCEADGDWDGAKAAYRRLIELEADGEQHGFLSAHDDLAQLHSLLGEQGPALEHARRATAEEERNSVTLVAYRCAIVHEAWLLLRANRIRAARRLVKRGLASFEEDCPDDLGYATLQTTWAACEVAARRAAAAEQWLQAAWTYLEAIRVALDVDGGADAASGLQSAYAAWWSVEANRRRMIGDGTGEVAAWEQAIAYGRRAATGWNRVGWDVSVMRDLRSLASAQHRQGQNAEAAETRSAAEAIRLRWRLPMVETPKQEVKSGRSANWLRTLLRKRS